MVTRWPREAVPVRHFGLILPMERWEALAEKLQAAHRVVDSLVGVDVDDLRGLFRG